MSLDLKLAGGSIAARQEVPAFSRLLLRVEEAAEALGVSRTALYILLGSGEIPVVRIGRSVRVPVAALETYIDTHTTRAGVEAQE